MKSGRTIGLYVGLLTSVAGLADPNGGLVQLPLLFILKDTLHLSPQWLAWFAAATQAPGHLGVLFGLVRDRWRLRVSDRAWFLLVSGLVAAAYLWLALAPSNAVTLLVAFVAIAIAFQIFDAGSHALVTEVGKRVAMTGRLSAIAELSDNVASVAAMLAGGWLAAHTLPTTVFLSAFAVTSTLFVISLWRPGVIFAPREREERLPAAGAGLATAARLATSPGFWPVLAILLLYAFSPGWGTPFVFYLTGELHLSATVFGVCRAASFTAMALSTLLYGVLCQRFALRTLLWGTIAVNVLPGFLFLIIGDAREAAAVAALGGLCTGLGNVVLLDLLRRSSPTAMEGTANMMGLSAMALAWTLGDVLGAWLYEQGGFLLCIVLDAVATVLIVPLLLRLPARVISGRDGELSGSEALEVLPG